MPGGLYAGLCHTFLVYLKIDDSIRFSDRDIRAEHYFHHPSIIGRLIMQSILRVFLGVRQFCSI